MKEKFFAFYFKFQYARKCNISVPGNDRFFFIISLTENISISDTGLLKHYYWLNSYILEIFYLLYIFFINQTGDYKSLLNFVSKKEQNSMRGPTQTNLFEFGYLHINSVK